MVAIAKTPAGSDPKQPSSSSSPRVPGDEVVQEVLVSLTRSMPQFKYDPGKGKFRSYLKTVVLHEIFRKTRQKRGEVSLEEVDAATDSVAADPEIERVWEAEQSAMVGFK